MVFFLGKGLTEDPFANKKTKGHDTNATSDDSKFKDGGYIAEMRWKVIPAKVLGYDLSGDNKVIAGDKLTDKNKESGQSHHADILKPGQNYQHKGNKEADADLKDPEVNGEWTTD